MVRHRTVFFLNAAAVALAAFAFGGSANAATLINEDFQSPLYGDTGNNSQPGNPAFAGWTYNNSGAVKSRLSPNTGDFPGAAGNQGIQLEWTNAEANYNVSAPTWNAGDFFTLTLDVAPQQWNGHLDRYIEPSLRQGGSPIWTGNTLMNKWTGSPVWEQKQFFIPTAGFASGTDVELKIDHTGQRGIYFDNVMLEVGPPPVDNTPPSPDPPTWNTAPTVFDYTNAFMSVNPVSDPFGVEYLFTNTTTGDNSGWQDSTEWVNSGLDQNTNYNFTAVARDKSPNQNATGPAADSATTDSLEGLIFSSGFQYPEYPHSNSGSPSPDFVGWQWTNGQNVKSRVTPGQGDFPGDPGNQGAQFEWTNAAGSYATTHGWSADEMYSLSLNVAPQSWNGTQDRFFQVEVLEGDGTVLWQSGNVAIPHYNGFGGNPWPSELLFEFDIDGSLFAAVSGAAEGSPLTVRMTHSGFRGIYFDNVLFTFSQPQVGTAPEPSALILTALSLVGLVATRRRRRR